MGEKITLMQFSDLHIESSPKISPNVLSTSIVSDINHYNMENPKISKPEIIIVCGDITGLILSNIFVNEANQRIENMGERDRPFKDGNFTFNPQELTFSDVILPSMGVVVVCISTYLLAGLIAIYIKIFLKTNSRYIFGLLFFLFPLFIQSIFSVNTLRSLFVSSAIPYIHIRESIGFGIGGLGSILVILSIFEIIGLSILLYLSSE